MVEQKPKVNSESILAKKNGEDLKSYLGNEIHDGEFMARPGIHYQAVVKAAEKIEAQDENPTVERIRQALGTGSNSIIAKHLRAWREQVVTPDVQNSHIPSTLVSTIEGLWEQLQTHAQQAIEKAQSNHQADIETYNEKLLGKEEAIVRLNAKLEAEIEDKHLLLEELQKAKQKHEEQSTRVNELTSSNHALISKTKQQESETARLEQLLKQNQDNLIHYQNAVKTQRQEDERKHVQEKQSLSHKLHQLEEQHNTLSSEHEQLKGHHLATKNQLALKEREYKELLEGRNEIVMLLKDMNANYAVLKYSSEKDKNHTKDLEDKNNQYLQENSRYLSRITSLEKEISVLLLNPL